MKEEIIRRFTISIALAGYFLALGAMNLFTELAADGGLSAWDIAVTAVGWTLYDILITSPLWIGAIVVAVVIIRWRRKQGQRKPSMRYIAVVVALIVVGCTAAVVAVATCDDEFLMGEDAMSGEL